MENSFGHDFSRIRVYEGGAAPALRAVAFTRREQLHFAPGAYRPYTMQGQALLGHELAHVVQQRAGMVRPTARLAGASANLDPTLETHADAAGRRAASGIEAFLRPIAPTRGDAAEPRVVQAALWPWMLAGAGLAAAGYAYRRLRGGGGQPHNPDQLAQPFTPAMRVPLTQDAYDAQKNALGDHPKFRWNDEQCHVDTEYDGFQLSELHGTIFQGLPEEHLPEKTSARGLEQAFGTLALNTRRGKDEAALREKAAGRINQFNEDAQQGREKKPTIIPGVGESKRSTGGIGRVRALLKKSGGVVFGEDHGQHHTKLFMAKNMKTLRKSGVNTLYVEHLRAEHQEDLDEWYKNPEGEMTDNLRRYVDGMDETYS
ncbi:MAG TPA: DUF4157 domain-containing protein, partial [Longimicrobium sp.]|nr:DUF4157 domain-containing protein [Longimicrobium sp.]